VVAVLPIPRSVEATTRFIECGVGLGGASARSMEGLRQIRNLDWAADLEAFVDRPGITAGRGDQQRDAYVVELHRAARSIAALRLSISCNAGAAACPPVSDAALAPDCSIRASTNIPNPP
jgi:hypothetical protein